MTQITAEQFHRLIGVDDAYKAPDRLMEILYDKPRREQLFRDFLEATQYEVETDTFRQYFEDVHAARKDLKQDFTPASIAMLTAKIAGEPGGPNFYEGCAGTGGMLIASWNNNRIKHSPFCYKPSWYFYTVEELSDRAFPFLLFNCALRGMNAVVVHCDVLTREAKGAFFVQNENNDHMQFSSINLMPYDESVEYELNIRFDGDERYDELLESEGIPAHIFEEKNDPTDYEICDATKFLYALCGIEVVINPDAKWRRSND